MRAALPRRGPLPPGRARGIQGTGRETPMAERKMTDAQRAYEEKRAKKAGMSLEKWLVAKERERAEEAKAAAPEPPKPAKRPGFFQRLIERAEKPLK
jgi:hypothetical protein